MTGAFSYDVFLGHSAKDKAAVRPLAERLQRDGLGVWFDEWVLKPGDSIPAKIEKQPAHSNLLRNEGGRTCRCVELTAFEPYRLRPSAFTRLSENKRF